VAYPPGGLEGLVQTLGIENLSKSQVSRMPPSAWHTSGYTNGPVEGLNSLIKKIERVAAGFRSFANYRLRILLAIGGCNWDLLGTPPREDAKHRFRAADIGEPKMSYRRGRIQREVSK
jgi:Transposase